MEEGDSKRLEEGETGREGGTGGGGEKLLG